MNNYIGITPDGPRGPKEIVSEGIIKDSKKNKNSNYSTVVFGHQKYLS